MSMNLKDDRNPSKKFKRDGSRYVCSKCKTKFFGKAEVEACFDGHPEEPAEASTESKSNKPKAS